MSDVREVWITKYALTQGLFRVVTEMVPVPDKPGHFYASSSGIFTMEWAESEEDAIEAFRVKRDKKIASLKRQISRLEVSAVKFRKASR